MFFPLETIRVQTRERRAVKARIVIVIVEKDEKKYRSIELHFFELYMKERIKIWK